MWVSFAFPFLGWSGRIAPAEKEYNARVKKVALGNVVIFHFDTVSQKLRYLGMMPFFRYLVMRMII